MVPTSPKCSLPPLDLLNPMQLKRQAHATKNNRKALRLRKIKIPKKAKGLILIIFILLKFAISLWNNNCDFLLILTDSFQSIGIFKTIILILNLIWVNIFFLIYWYYFDIYSFCASFTAYFTCTCNTISKIVFVFIFIQISLYLLNVWKTGQIKNLKNNKTQKYYAPADCMAIGLACIVTDFM